MSAPFIFPPRTRSNSPAPNPHHPHGVLPPPPHPFPPQIVPNGNHTEDGGDDESGTVADANPFPYPPWYPESAHFVRQWWPTLASVPRLSCTVVLLADHEPDTHRTRYVLAQHYFKVPLIEPDDLEQIPAAAAKAVEDTYAPVSPSGFPTQKAFVKHSPNGSFSSSSSSTTSSVSSEHDWNGDTPGEADTDADAQPKRAMRGAESSMMRLWYVSEPFEVVCVLDGMDDEFDPDGAAERPRPLMAVDFGHAVWIEFAFPPEMDRDEKRLRFVTFPPVTHDRDEMAYGCADGDGNSEGNASTSTNGSAEHSLEGVVRTLEIPDELDLDTVETINIDQSQGAIIISVRDGKIFILCYE